MWTNAKFQRSTKTIKKAGNYITRITRISEYVKQIREKTKRFDRENWGYPFIAGFMLLLLGAAFLLAIGWAPVAESTATLAYFALLIGVVLQLIFLRKIHEEGGSRV